MLQQLTPIPVVGCLEETGLTPIPVVGCLEETGRASLGCSTCCFREEGKRYDA